MPARVAHADRKPSLVIAGPGFPGSVRLRRLPRVLRSIDRGGELADQLLRNVHTDERRELVRREERPFLAKQLKIFLAPLARLLSPVRRRAEQVLAPFLMAAEISQKDS